MCAGRPVLEIGSIGWPAADRRAGCGNIPFGHGSSRVETLKLLDVLRLKNEVYDVVKKIQIGDLRKR